MVSGRFSGILVHPTSFPSPYGIGDLGEGAKSFIDFLTKSSQTLWQILPLSPTGFSNSPYQSCSTFALNHLLISPEKLKEEQLLSEEDLSCYPSWDNMDNYVDYGKVYEHKTELFKKAFSNFIKMENNPLYLKFLKFCEQQKHWLEDYSLFVTIKEYFIQKRKETQNPSEFAAYKKEYSKYLEESEINDNYYGATWNSWPKDIMKRKPESLISWKNTLRDEIKYNNFLQFIAFRQWEELKEYANDNNIQIIGDLPIFVAYDSADVWVNKNLFLLDGPYPKSVAGVPPDYFSETGQLWGNPLYDWKKHESYNFDWWIKRLRHVLSLVDIVRIDHFRGFVSCWSIPFGEKTAVKGKWVKSPGEKLFSEIKRRLGNLSIIAEDLGIITEEVTKLRLAFGLPGMKILQFGFEGGAESDYLPHNFDDINSVVYTGTHDNDTSKGWYAASNEKIKDYLRRYLNVSGENISWDLIRLAFMSNAKMAIVPIQDILELDTEYRMNTPGEKEGCWQFRYKQEMLLNTYSNGLKYLSELSNRNSLILD